MAIATPVAFDEYQWYPVIDAVDLRPATFHLPLHGDEHPPGHAYWGAVGTWVFGKNLLGYRAASVALGTLLVLIVFLIARESFGEPAGLWAAFLAASNEYLIGGVSRMSTEKSYLTFMALALLLFMRALSHPTTRRFVRVGVAGGLGMLTKQAGAIWLPLLLVELVRRPDGRKALKTWGPYLAVVACVLMTLPDLIWNLTVPPEPGTSNVGIGYQLEKLSVGSWSWGPTALFLRFLIYPAVDPDVHEYPAMSAVPGALLLVGALASLAVLRQPGARLLQLLGWGTFLFYSLFAGYPGDVPAFWWSDLAIVPFIVLSAATLSAVVRPVAPVYRIAAGLAIAMPFLAAALSVTLTSENVFVSSVMPPPEAAVAKATRRQRFQFANYPAVDHAALAHVGSLCLPVARTYVDSFAKYLAGDVYDRQPLEDQYRRLLPCGGAKAGEGK